MAFDVLKVYISHSTGKHISVLVKFDDGRETRMPIDQFVGILKKIPCNNASYADTDGMYVQGKNCELLHELVYEKPQPIQKKFVKAWEMDMTSIFIDILRTISNTYLKEFLCVRGGIALSIFLSGNPELIRRTTDIDLDFHIWDAWDDFARKSAELLTMNSTAGYAYNNDGRKNSVNVDGTDTLYLICNFGGQLPVQFNIDMNVRVVDDVVFTDEGLRIASVSNMLCDKLSVIASDKVLYRVKDLYDIYAFSFLNDITMQSLLDEWYKLLERSDVQNIYTFNADNRGGIQAVYERMDRFVSIADFQTVLSRAALFAINFFNLVSHKVLESNLAWDGEKGIWK